MQITNRHLKFLEEAKDLFSNNPRASTHRDEDVGLIALRYGLDRDCIWTFELGEEVAFFAQQIPPSPPLIVDNRTSLKPEKLDSFMYGLMKEVRKFDLMERLETWEISETDYQEIEHWFKQFGTKL